MAHDYRTDGPGGIAHVVLACGILLGLSVYGIFPQQVDELVYGHDAATPRMVVTRGAEIGDCAARSVETPFGTLGCAGTKKRKHLEKIARVGK